MNIQKKYLPLFYKKYSIVEISQYIQDLLFTHDRVILSQFGAFNAKYRPATINEEQKTMTPPGKDIVFDPSITEDGGLLRDYMMQQEKISSEEADKQIIEYVKTVKSKLNAGKKVHFVELGTFEKDSNGNIIFTHNQSETLLTDSYGMTNIDLPEDVDTTNIPEENPEPKKKKRRFRWLFIIGSIILFLFLVWLLIFWLRPQWLSQGKAYITNMFNKNAEVAQDDNASNKDDDSTYKNNDNKSDLNDKTNDPANDVTPVDNEDTNPKVPESTDTGNTTDNSDQQNNPYSNIQQGEKGYSYLVVGSLQSPEKAEEQKQVLQQQGIETIIIQAGDSYRLCIGKKFKNYLEASKYYDDFHTNHKKIEIWLWEN